MFQKNNVFPKKKIPNPILTAPILTTRGPGGGVGGKSALLLQNTFTTKPLELGSWNIDRMSTFRNLSHVMCHLSCVMFYESHVTSHVSQVTCYESRVRCHMSSLKHLHSQIVWARELKLWQNVHLIQPVPYYVSCFTNHMSQVTFHMSHVIFKTLSQPNC